MGTVNDVLAPILSTMSWHRTAGPTPLVETARGLPALSPSELAHMVDCVPPFDHGPWQIRDTFSREWTISLAGFGEGRNPKAAPTFEQREVVESLVYFSFDHMGAKDDDVAWVLLKVYDVIACTKFSAKLPRPTHDPRRLLVGFDRELRSELLNALAAEWLKIERAERAPWSLTEVKEESASAPQELVGEQTTFIAIQLVDQNGKPVPRRRYQITLPDGTVLQGILASNGTARVDDIGTPGQCEIDFLDFDEVDWGPQTLHPGATQAGATGPVTSGGADDGATDNGTPNSEKPPPSSQPAAVSPSVTHKFVDRNSNPLANIAWQVSSSDDTVVGSGVTDATGMVNCPVPSEGQYNLRYNHQVDQEPADGTSTEIDTTEDYST